MPLPKFLAELRSKIGHDLVWAPAVTVVVTRQTDADPEVLLQHRADLDVWGPPGGIVEPGEDPDLAAVREVYEETGVDVRIERLLWIFANKPFTYPNQDQVQYFDVVFHATAIKGEPKPIDDESLDVRWWPLAELPPMFPHFESMIDMASDPTHQLSFGLAKRRGIGC